MTARVDECVVDTMVLRKANAPLEHKPRSGSEFVKRLRLLREIQAGTRRVLYSGRLLAEYATQIPSPRNDAVAAFLACIAAPDASRSRLSWRRPWKGEKDMARQCRFPVEDDHVLRTAICDHPTTIFSEEDRMLAANACIYRKFRVHIVRP